ncbi:MAG TPA: hypothetical protein VGK58_05940 [Lacipirellulaceae bacterium]
MVRMQELLDHIDTGKLAANQPIRPARQFIAICVWYAQVLAILAMLAMVIFFDIETIVATGPTLTVIGLALALVTRPLVNLHVLLFGISAPLICALGALIIAFFELDPGEAYAPILTILSLYALLILPLALLARRTIREWSVTSRPRWVLRYNMKSLFAAMTGVCVAATILSYLANVALGFPIVFGAFGVIAAALPFVIAWRFRSDRRQLDQSVSSEGAISN